MTISELHQAFLNSTGICTDTRKIKKDNIFFALKGDNFDGNKYAEKAWSAGASLCVIDDKNIKKDKFILTEDVLTLLQKLANYHRNYLNIPIIALTGSNGKTTTKELIATVLHQKYNITATQGNLNNHIGVPLTLLSMNDDTEIGVVEMGANHLKEIELLCNIAEPNYGYITNIGKAHLEGFGSEENILIGKTELYEHIKRKNGLVFSNQDDKKLIQKSEGIKLVTFSDNKNSNYNTKIIKTTPLVSVEFDDIEINSNLIGEYNYTNIAASIVIGAHFKVNSLDIKKAIESYIPKINRSQLIEKDTNSIILDAYNANPSSMQVAIENFIKTETNKPKIAILGDMFELGNYALKEHQAIVDLIKESKEINEAYFVGENFYNVKIENEKLYFKDSTESLIIALKKDVITDSLILIKGSRGMALERVLDFL